MVYGRKSLGRRCFVGNLFHGGHRCISLREREVWSCRTCDAMEGPGDSPVPCQTPGWTPPLLSLDVLSLSLGLFMYGCCRHPDWCLPVHRGPGSLLCSANSSCVFLIYALTLRLPLVAENCIPH